MTLNAAILRLSAFVRKMACDKVKDKVAYREWRRDHEKNFEQALAYKRRGKMPAASALLGVSFHPDLPLVLLNYTPVAHNTLHQYPEGWTLPLKQCRGIIFDYDGALVAKAFPKFFNHGEHPDTTNLPDESFVATQKHDGHLGIIFYYRGSYHITTRGEFTSRTTVLAQKMLNCYVKKYGWEKQPIKDWTLLAEIIHPKTKVHLEYNNARKFILLAAISVSDFREMEYDSLKKLGASLRLPVAEKWSGDSIQELRRLVGDVKQSGKEGYVVRFAGGLRVKFKFQWYLNLMVAAKLSHVYLMKRVMAGNVEKMIGRLPEEIYTKAQTMLKDLMKVKDLHSDEKAKWQYLYDLVPAAQSSSSYCRAVCREFLRHISGVHKTSRVKV